MKLIQTVLTPTHVIKDPSVLISMNALLEPITVMNMPNATIMRAHSHAHVKKDGLVPHMVQEAAQTTMNVPTVFKPSHPLPVAEERKAKDSKTAQIHQVFVQTGQVVPISACWMMSKKMDTNASALLDTLHPQPTLRPTSLLNVLTLMNALMKHTAVMLVPH